MTLRSALFGLLPVGLLLLLAACATGGLPDSQFRSPNKSHSLTGVPFHPQERFQCGPASLASVLNYLGDDVHPGKIADTVYREDIRGSVSLDLVLFAKSRGHRLTWTSGSAALLMQNLEQDFPLMVMVDQGISLVSQYHYLVVIGYDPEGVIAHNGLNAQAHIPWKTFLKQWNKTQNWVLVPDHSA